MMIRTAKRTLTAWGFGLETYSATTGCRGRKLHLLLAVLWDGA